MVISLEKVSFGYTGRETLRELDLQIAPGSFHFLTGPSGAGKTTLLKLLYLEHQPTAGRLRLFGDDAVRLDRRLRTLIRRRIGVVFQDFRLLEHLNVTENVALPIRVQGRGDETQKGDVSDLVRWVGLAHRADAYPRELSAGEKQRTAIARAVITAPDVILADEPTGNIDFEMGARILRFLIELNRLGKTVVVATHDLAIIRHARNLVQARTLRLVEGRLEQAGSDL